MVLAGVVVVVAEDAGVMLVVVGVVVVVVVVVGRCPRTVDIWIGLQESPKMEKLCWMILSRRGGGYEDGSLG